MAHHRTHGVDLRELPVHERRRAQALHRLRHHPALSTEARDRARRGAGTWGPAGGDLSSGCWELPRRRLTSRTPPAGWTQPARPWLLERHGDAADRDTSC